MTLDRRLHAYRDDLADIALEGQVHAARFIEPAPARIAVPLIALRPKPQADCGIDTELLLGEEIWVFERANGWAWVKAALDGYVGYVPESAITANLTNTMDESAPTHWIVTPRSFLYSGPDLRFANPQPLSMGARLKVVGEAETRGSRYFLLEDGRAIFAAHARAIGVTDGKDAVDLALLFLQTPYLWGGRSGQGIDCSGLVQLCLHMQSQKAPRDTDMQAASLGTEITRDALKRGDLVFWKGHVGIMEDETTLIHANGHTMTVARENLNEAIDRIGWLYAAPTGYRRPL